MGQKDQGAALLRLLTAIACVSFAVALLLYWLEL